MAERPTPCEVLGIEPGPRQHMTWSWSCPRCTGQLITVRDTSEGRALLATLAQAMETTLAALMRRGVLTRIDMRTGMHWLCECPALQDLPCPLQQ